MGFPFSVGDYVKVETREKTREGQIIFINACNKDLTQGFFTVQFDLYPEAFQFFDLKTGVIRLEKVNR